MTQEQVASIHTQALVRATVHAHAEHQDWLHASTQHQAYVDKQRLKKLRSELVRNKESFLLANCPKHQLKVLDETEAKHTVEVKTKEPQKQNNIDMTNQQIRSQVDELQRRLNALSTGHIKDNEHDTSAFFGDDEGISVTSHKNTRSDPKSTTSLNDHSLSKTTNYGMTNIDGQQKTFTERATASLSIFFRIYDPSMVESIPDAVAMLGGNAKNFELLCSNLQIQYGARPEAVIAGGAQILPFDQQALYHLTEFYKVCDPSMVDRVPDVVVMLARTPANYRLLCNNLKEQYGTAPLAIDESVTRLGVTNNNFGATSTGIKNNIAEIADVDHKQKSTGYENEDVVTSAKEDDNVPVGRQGQMSTSASRRLTVRDHAAKQEEEGSLYELGDVSASNIETDDEDYDTKNLSTKPKQFVKQLISKLRNCLDMHIAHQSGARALAKSQWQQNLTTLSSALDKIVYAGSRLQIPDSTLEMLADQIQSMMTLIEDEYMADDGDSHAQNQLIATDTVINDANERLLSSDGIADDDDEEDIDDSPRYSEAGSVSDRVVRNTSGSPGSIAAYDMAIEFVKGAHETLRLCAETNAVAVTGTDSFIEDEWQPLIAALNSHLDAVESGSIPLPPRSLQVLQGRLTRMIQLIEDVHLNMAHDITTEDDDEEDRLYTNAKTASTLFADVKRINQKLRDRDVALQVTRGCWKKYLDRVRTLIEFITAEAGSKNDEFELSSIVPTLFPQLAHMMAAIEEYIATAPSDTDAHGTSKDDTANQKNVQSLKYKKKNTNYNRRETKAVRKAHEGKRQQKLLRHHHSKKMQTSSPKKLSDTDVDSEALDETPSGTHSQKSENIFIRGIRNVMSQVAHANREQYIGRHVLSADAWKSMQLQLQVCLGNLRDEFQNLAPTLADELEDQLEALLSIVEERYIDVDRSEPTQQNDKDIGYNPLTQNINAIKIQRSFRAHYLRSRFQRKRSAVIFLQKLQRGHLVRLKRLKQEDELNSVSSLFMKSQIAKTTSSIKNQNISPMHLLPTEIEQVLDWLDHVFGDPAVDNEKDAQSDVENVDLPKQAENYRNQQKSYHSFTKFMQPKDWEAIYNQLQNYVQVAKSANQIQSRMGRYVLGKSKVYLHLLEALISTNKAVTDINGGMMMMPFETHSHMPVTFLKPQQPTNKKNDLQNIEDSRNLAKTVHEYDVLKSTHNNMYMESKSIALQTAVLADQRHQDDDETMTQDELPLDVLSALVDKMNNFFEQNKAKDAANLSLASREVCTAIIVHIEASLYAAKSKGLHESAPIYAKTKKLLQKLRDHTMSAKPNITDNHVDRKWLEDAASSESKHNNALDDTLSALFTHAVEQSLDKNSNENSSMKNIDQPSVRYQTPVKPLSSTNFESKPDLITQQTMQWGVESFGRERFNRMYMDDPQLWHNAAKAAIAAQAIEIKRRNHAAAVVIQANQKACMSRKKYLQRKRSIKVLQRRIREKKKAKQVRRLYRPDARGYTKLLRINANSYYRRQLHRFLFDKHILPIGKQSGNATLSKQNIPNKTEDIVSRSDFNSSKSSSSATAAAAVMHTNCKSLSIKTSKQSKVPFAKMTSTDKSRYSNLIWEHRVLASTLKLQRWLQQCWLNRRNEKDDQPIYLHAVANDEHDVEKQNIKDIAITRVKGQQRHAAAQVLQALIRGKLARQKANTMRQSMIDQRKIVTNRIWKRLSTPLSQLIKKSSSKTALKDSQIKNDMVDQMPTKESKEGEIDNTTGRATGSSHTQHVNEGHITPNTDIVNVAINLDNNKEEQRIDIDGNAYTRVEFLDYYGGIVEWDKAPKAMDPLSRNNLTSANESYSQTKPGHVRTKSYQANERSVEREAEYHRVNKSQFQKNISGHSKKDHLQGLPELPGQIKSHEDDALRSGVLNIDSKKVSDSQLRAIDHQQKHIPQRQSRTMLRLRNRLSASRNLYTFKNAVRQCNQINEW